MSYHWLKTSLDCTLQLCLTGTAMVYLQLPCNRTKRSITKANGWYCLVGSSVNQSDSSSWSWYFRWFKNSDNGSPAATTDRPANRQRAENLSASICITNSIWQSSTIQQDTVRIGIPTRLENYWSSKLAFWLHPNNGEDSNWTAVID